MKKTYPLMPLLFIVLNLSVVNTLFAQKHPQGKLADKPLFQNPVLNGTTGPTLVWNKNKKKWYMFYTSENTNVKNTKDVSWNHCARIEIAESADGGATWIYKDTANINYRPDSGYTFRAPEVLEHHGLFHMFLTYAPGVFEDWDHPSQIIHFTSIDLINWKYVSTLKLASDKVIDACVIKLSDGNWRMWYNNERDAKSIYYADSPDLFHWHNRGKVLSDHRGEAPNVFHWKNKYWMVVDQWAGLAVYLSTDLLNWLPLPEQILEHPATGPKDGTKGSYPDVIVNEERAFIFYSLQPERDVENDSIDHTETQRNVIQVAELKFEDGVLSCDRDQPVYVNLRTK